MEKKDKMKRVTESEIRMIDILRAYGIKPEIIVKEISHLAAAARPKVNTYGEVKKISRERALGLEK